MKLYNFIVFIVLFFSISYSSDYLISVHKLPQAEWQRHDVVKVMYDTYIILATDKTLKELTDKHIVFKTLDQYPLEQSDEYFIVFPMAESKFTIMKTARILYEHEYFYIVRVSKAKRDAFMALRVDRSFISFKKYHFSYIPSHPIQPPNICFSDGIQNIVNSVSKDSLRSYVSKLEKFDSRLIKVNQDAMGWLVSKFKEVGADSSFISEVPTFVGNVVGVLKGTDHKPNQYCLLGAHVDAAFKGPPAAGADDNASGTAALLEACRVMKKLSFKHTIYFIAFDGEEVGKLGSGYYAQNARKRGDSIIGGCINYDMIGYSKSDPTLWIHYTSSVRGNNELAKTFETCAKTYVPDLNVKLLTTSGIMYASDHSSFWENKYPAFLAIEAKDRGGLCPNYHKPGDLLDDQGGLNDSELMTKSTKAAVATLASYAITNATPIISKFQKSISIPHVRIVKNISGISHISFTTLKNNTPVKIDIFDMQGKLIHTSPTHTYMSGDHTVLLSKALGKGLCIVTIQLGQVCYSQRHIRL